MLLRLCQRYMQEDALVQAAQRLVLYITNSADTATLRQDRPLFGRHLQLLLQIDGANEDAMQQLQ